MYVSVCGHMYAYILYCTFIVHIVLCTVSLLWQKASNLTITPLRAKPGDNITMFCDRMWETGSDILWFRGFSTDVQTWFNISARQAYTAQVYNLPAYHLIPKWNDVNKSYDLVIRAVTESDHGLYYCASKPWKKVYNFSQDVSWVSVLENSDSSDIVPTTSAPIPWKSDRCWMLLVSLCLVCVLLSTLISSACVFFLCRKTDNGTSEHMLQSRSDLQMKRNRTQNDDGDLFYASLHLPKGKHKPRHNDRTHNSDFTTYSGVRCNRQQPKPQANSIL
ncbi:hypothetical protein ACEWY4_006882 [Coilia grayii]|uniref:Ig-like domain-containing protein n=1 Tax=Coilia grayii TaxID=363190 RepID=A0ABD1KEP5_9TELE